MLPEFLVSTYRQYKEDEKTITNWLCVTAKQLGYTSVSLPDPVEPELKTPKLKTKKGKPRTKKQLRDAARRIPGRGIQKFTVEIKEFVPLAEHIVKYIKLPSVVPSSILGLMKRSIEARTDCNAWFKKVGADDEAVTGGHAYFIQILQKVHDILEPYTKLSEPAETDDETTLVENIYDGLSLEEPSEAFLQAAGVIQKSAEERLASKIVFELVAFVKGGFEEWLEQSFAASALFRDINKLYEHAKQIWYQYRDGKIDLMTASLTSNTAIDIIRRLEDDFFDRFPKFRRIDEAGLRELKKRAAKQGYKVGKLPKGQDAQQLINWMFRHKCSAAGLTSAVGEDFIPTLDEPFNWEVYDAARYVFVDMLTITALHYSATNGFESLVYQPDVGPGRWNSERNTSPTTNKDKFLEDAKILMEMLPDMIWLSTSQNRKLAEDELMRGCRDFQVQEIHLWTLVSARLFCDIHHILGPSIGNAFFDLQRLGKTAKDTIANAIAQREQSKSYCWPADQDSVIKENCIDIIDAWLFDDEWRRDVKAMAAGAYFIDEDHHLFRRHPLLCGLMEFSLRAMIQELGFYALNTYNTAVTVAYLYNAVQQEGFCTTGWQDMDTLIEMQGIDKIFMGKKPTNLDESFKRLSLYRGFSLEQFAANRRRRGHIFSSKQRRQLEGFGYLINLFKFRHCLHSDSALSAFALEKVDEILHLKLQLNRNNTQLLIVFKDNFKSSRDQTQVKHTYAPLELLVMLQFGLFQETAYLHFDYFGLNENCWMILKSLHTLLEPTIVDLCGFDFCAESDLTGDHMFKFILVVDFLFGSAIPVQQMVQLVGNPIFASSGDYMLRVAPKLKQNVANLSHHLRSLGGLLENKIQNGRLRSKMTSTMRQRLRTKMAIYELPQIKNTSSGVTFKKGKATFHKSTSCTSDHCLCGSKSRPIKCWNDQPKALKDLEDMVLESVKRGKENI